MSEERKKAASRESENMARKDIEDATLVSLTRIKQAISAYEEYLLSAVELAEYMVAASHDLWEPICIRHEKIIASAQKEHT